MTAKNEITGDTIATRTVSDAYRNQYDAIFGVKDRSKSSQEEDHKKDDSQPLADDNP